MSSDKTITGILVLTPTQRRNLLIQFGQLYVAEEQGTWFTCHRCGWQSWYASKQLYVNLDWRLNEHLKSFQHTSWKAV